MSFRPMRKFGEPFGRSLAPNATAKQRILAADPANLIGYWPLGDTSGSVADDISPTNADGAYAGTVTLAQPGIGDGSLSALFGGGRISLATNLAALNAVMGKTEITFAVWVKAAAGMWSDSANHYIMVLGADSNNRFRIVKPSTNNELDLFYHAGGTTKAVGVASFSPSNQFHVAATVSKLADQVRFFINGAQVGSTATGLGIWAGALASTFSCLADSNSAGGSAAWAGLMAHHALWNAALTPTQIAQLYIKN